MATVWPKHRVSLSLDQSLVTAMEDEGRWMIKNNLTTEKMIPDFMDYIYTEGLERVKPEAVSLVTAMEDEGRWMIANNLTTEKAIPNFRDYIYTKGLMEVNPEAVNIIE